MIANLKDLKEFTMIKNDDGTAFVKISTETYDICFNRAQVFVGDKTVTILALSETNDSAQMCSFTIRGNTVNI